MARMDSNFVGKYLRVLKQFSWVEEVSRRANHTEFTRSAGNCFFMNAQFSGISNI